MNDKVGCGIGVGYVGRRFGRGHRTAVLQYTRCLHVNTARVVENIQLAPCHYVFERGREAWRGCAARILTGTDKRWYVLCHGVVIDWN